MPSILGINKSKNITHGLISTAFCIPSRPLEQVTTSILKSEKYATFEIWIITNKKMNPKALH